MHRWWDSLLFQNSHVISTLEHAKGTLGNIESNNEPCGNIGAMLIQIHFHKFQQVIPRRIGVWRGQLVIRSYWSLFVNNSFQI